MKKIYKALAIITIIMAFPTLTYAAKNCFIAKENGKIIKQVGQCEVRHSPYSTFKIPIALMGFDAGILVSANSPDVEFTQAIEKQFITYYNPEKYPSMFLWKHNQTPKSWMRDSVVWYSRYITNKLGAKQFQNYVDKFNYGNKNIGGDAGKNNGLMNSWIDSSLAISPLEQIEFIDKLASRSLPVSKQAHEKTMEIIKMETIFNDFQLHGKTGGSMSFGWFVGWVEKDGRRIIFAQCIEQPEDSLISGGRMAKEIAKDNLIRLHVKK